MIGVMTCRRDGIGSAFLGFITGYYDRLPEHMLFIHADAPDHIHMQRPNILDDTIRAVLLGFPIHFVHLSHNRVTMRWEPRAMEVVWRGVFGSSIDPGGANIATLQSGVPFTEFLFFGA